MTSKKAGPAKSNVSKDVLDITNAQRKLQEATADAISAARSLEREVKLQQAATDELRTSLEAKQSAASDSLKRASKLIAAIKRPGGLWGEVARDLAQVGEGRGDDDLIRALQESSAICESFIGQGGNDELVKRIDEVIEMLGGDP